MTQKRGSVMRDKAMLAELEVQSTIKIVGFHSGLGKLDRTFHHQYGQHGHY